MLVDGQTAKTVVVIGCDHGAYSAKESIKKFLESKKDLEVIDVGCYSEASVDYPDIATLVCTKISGEGKGILLCGSGVGVSMAANKHKGIRAALCHDVTTARLCREHNDANVLCAGARIVGLEVLLDMVRFFLETPFSHEERHVKRINKMNQI